MKRFSWIRLLGLLSVLMLLFACWPTPVMSGGNESTDSKISSLLSMHIKTKKSLLADSTQGMMKSFGAEAQSTGETTLSNNERVFLHFAQQPTEAQINELNSLGVTLYPQSWIPPVNDFKTGFVLADMPVNQLDSLAAKSYVVTMDTAEQILSPLNDQAREGMNVDPVWNGGDTGAGVTVAVLDSGLDTTNPDFPTPIATIDYSNYPTTDTTITNMVSGHGTHVTGSLLGRGVNSADYKYQGVAPGASLVFIKIGNDTNGAASSDAVTYAMRDAVEIYHAKIINLSYGEWSEYHDGTDQVCQTIDYVTSLGAAVFVAAGNDADKGWHYSGMLAANSTTGDISVTVASGSTSYLPINLVWADGVGIYNGLSLQYYDSNHNLLASSSDSGTESFRGTESVVYGLNASLGAGTYYIRVSSASSNSNNQSFHVYYIGGSSAVAFSTPDPNYTIESPAEADDAIAVGAYVTRNSWTNYQGSTYTPNSPQIVGTISSFSSRGPRIDGLSKPDVVAPGSAIISIRDSLYLPGNANYDPAVIDNDGQNLDGSGPANYYVLSGTSMASPMAAGVGALLLNKNPTLTPLRMKQALETSANDKGSPGMDVIYGYGLIDASGAANIDGISGKIVYTSYPDYGPLVAQIGVMNADGSNQTRLAYGANPVLSPDGGRIAFIGESNGNRLCIMSTNGTDITELPAYPLSGGGVSWSPDGSKIGFTEFSDNYPEIFTLNADGSSPQQLTTGAFSNIHPAWSSDGNRIAFVSDRDGRTSQQIYVMNADGTEQTRITNESDTGISALSWEPSGTRIIYDTFTGYPAVSKGICIINSDGTGRTQLPLIGALQGAAWPVWSPDGQKIAFQNMFSPWRIYIANSDGTHISQLTYNGSSQPSWGPGKWLALPVTTNDAINLDSNSVQLNGVISSLNSLNSAQVSFQIGTSPGDYTIETSRQTVTSSGPFAAHLSGLVQGTVYYFRTKASGDGIGYGTEKTFVFGTAFPTVRTNAADNVTSNNATLIGNLISMGASSSVGVAFEYGATKSYGSNTQTIALTGTNIFFTTVANLLPHTLYHYRANADGGNNGTSTGEDMTFITPAKIDGSRIAYYLYTNNNYEIYIMNSDGTSQSRLTNNSTDDFFPAFSPDGTKIAFVSKRNGNEEIYAMNADGSNQTRLTNDAALDNTYPDWSPDGTRIMYLSGPANTSESDYICVMNSDGSQQARLTGRISYIKPPSWSPDGTKIAFPVDGQIFTMNADGSHKTQITQNTLSLKEVENPIWSPDGTKILFEWWRNDFTPSTFMAEIFVVGSDGSDLARIAADPSNNITGAGWSPDGTKIAYSVEGYDPMTIIAYSDGSGTIWGIQGFTNPVWSPDSQKICVQAIFGIFAIDINRSDLVRLSYGNGPVSWAPGTWSTGEPAVSSNPVSNLVSTAATLNGNLTKRGSAAEVSVSFDWGTDTNYTGGNIVGVPATLSGPGSFAGDLTGLAPGQTYHYRAKAVGDGVAYGNDIAFTTSSLKLAFISNSQTINAGEPSGVITVQTQDNSGNPVSVSTNTTISLASSSTDGLFSLSNVNWTNTTSAAISAGDNSLSFYYKDIKIGRPIITISGSNLTGDGQQETVIAGSIDHYTVSDIASQQTTGIGFHLTIQAKDSFNNNLMTGNETINLSFGLADPGATPTSVSTINGTANITNMKMTVAQTNQTIIFTGAISSKIGISNTFDVNPAGVAKLSVTDYPSPAIAGISGNFTVTAQDQSGAIVTGYAGTLHFTSSDSLAILPDDYTFVSEDKGTKTFSATLKIAGTQSITATDTLTGSIHGIQNGIVITPGVESKLMWGTQPPSTVVAGTTWAGFTIEIADQYGNRTEDTNNISIVPSSGGLGGTLTQPAVAGLASFNDVSCTHVGALTLKAISGNLTAAPASNTITVNAAVPVVYVGGGGGGSSAINLNIKGFASTEPLKTNSDGIVQEAAKIKSADGLFSLDIAKGTKILTKILTAVTNLSVGPVAAPPRAPFGDAFIAAYDFGPEDATFDPPATFTFSYSSLPANMDENSISVVYYDVSYWDTVPGKLDTQARTITAQISHFSIYAVVGRISEPAALTPTPSPEPTPTPTPVAVATPSPTPVAVPPPTATPSPIPSASPTPTGSYTPLAISPAIEVRPTPAQNVSPQPTAPPPAKQFPWMIISVIVVCLAVVLTVAMITVRIKRRP